MYTINNNKYIFVYKQTVPYGLYDTVCILYNNTVYNKYLCLFLIEKHFPNGHRNRL